MTYSWEREAAERQARREEQYRVANEEAERAVLEDEGNAACAAHVANAMTTLSIRKGPVQIAKDIVHILSNLPRATRQGKEQAILRYLEREGIRASETVNQ